MPDLDPRTAASAEAIRQRLSDKTNLVRSDGDLNSDARVRLIAKAYDAANTEMDALQSTFTGGATKSAETLTQQVFGAKNVTGAEAISARDADERASQLKDAREGLELLHRTESNGDQVLARAIALRAFTASQDFFGGSDWLPVLDRYCETHPGVEEKMLEIQSARRNNLSVAGMFVFVIPKPTELSSLSDSRIQIIANS